MQVHHWRLEHHDLILTFLISTTALLSGVFQAGQDSVAKKQGLTSIDLTQCGK